MPETTSNSASDAGQGLVVLIVVLAIVFVKSFEKARGFGTAIAAQLSVEEYSTDNPMPRFQVTGFPVSEVRPHFWG